MSSAASPLFTPEEYLELERAAETKSEYHDGEIVAMAGGTGPHSLLAMKLGSELTQRLKGRPCLVFNSDMKVWVGERRHFFYPDLSGLCGQPQYHDEMRDVLVNPSFIVEVLSPKTEGYDRGKKLARYMALPSLVELALVNQDEVRVDKYTRQPDGIWRFDSFAGLDAVVQFQSVGCDVPLRDFYAGVELAPLTLPPWSAARLREDEPL
jgi:Uma2 family endonuclease